METHPIFESDFDCLTDKGIVNMKVRILFLATLVPSKQDDLDPEKVKKDEAEDFDQTAVVAQALENVRKIFKDINTENGRENAIKDLEKLLGEADQFVDTMDF